MSPKRVGNVIGIKSITAKLITKSFLHKIKKKAITNKIRKLNRTTYLSVHIFKVEGPIKMKTDFNKHKEIQNFM